MNSSIGRKTFIAFVALLAWYAIGLQFKLSLHLTNNDFLATVKEFLSYFTVTTNIIMAFCLTTIWLFGNSSLGKFFAKPATLTAITVYITVVALVYNTLLRGLVLPVGWARVADELLHVVDPILFIAFWIFFVDKSKLEYKEAITWMIYPMLYVVFVVVRGVISGQYPYPFINVVKLGYPTAILNATIVVVIFYLLSLLLIFTGKRTSQNS